MSQVIGVFKGGGAKGALYCGALQAVRDRGISFSQVAGSSAGAITAAFIAAGATPEALRGFERDGRHLLEMPSGVASALHLRNRDGILSYDDLRRWIARHLIELLEVKAAGHEVASDEELGPTFTEMRDAGAVPLHIACADLRWRSPVVFNAELTPHLPVAEAAAASSAVPLIFEAPFLFRVEEGGAAADNRQQEQADQSGDEAAPELRLSRVLLSDGGVMANLPLFIFTDPGYRAVAGLEPLLAPDPIVAFTFVDIETPRHTTSTGKVGDAYRHRYAGAGLVTTVGQILKDIGPNHSAPRPEEPNLTPASSDSEVSGDNGGAGAIPRRRSRVRHGIERAAARVLDLILRVLEVLILPPINLLLRLVGNSSAASFASRTQNPRASRWLRFADGVLDVAPGLLVIGIILVVPVLIFGIPEVVTFLWPDWSGLLADRPIGEGLFSVLIVFLVLLLAWAGLVVGVAVVVLGVGALVAGWVTKPIVSRIGLDLVATFMQNPQEPPWAGAGDREVIIRLKVPEGWTLLKSTDDDDKMDVELGKVRRSVDKQLEEKGLGTPLKGRDQ